MKIRGAVVRMTLARAARSIEPLEDVKPGELADPERARLCE
jgi:hypothetical protein